MKGQACFMTAVLLLLGPSLRAQDRGPQPRRPSSIAEFVSREKNMPTTGQNVRMRFETFREFILQRGEPDRYMTREDSNRIRMLIDDEESEEAARLLRGVILRLDKSRGSGPDGGGRGPRGRPGAGNTRRLENIVRIEKRTPTTEADVLVHRDEFVRAMVESGAPMRYVPTGSMAFIEDLLAQGKGQEAAAKLHQVIIAAGERLAEEAGGRSDPGVVRLLREPSRPEPGGAGGTGSSAGAAPAQADRASASTLYFKAMQEYADGKLDPALSLLESGAKLDPTNQDIVKALERLRKER